jgi:hypothetical protein
MRIVKPYSNELSRQTGELGAAAGHNSLNDTSKFIDIEETDPR